jgi:hypothetical protein
VEARDQVRERGLRGLQRVLPAIEIDASERIEMQAHELVAETLEQQLRVGVDRRFTCDALGFERARDDIERLLRARGDHDVVGLDIEPARLQPLRDRLAQRPVTLGLVLRRHALAEHRARTLRDALGRKQLRIDEHGGQRRRAARGKIRWGQRRPHEHGERHAHHRARRRKTRGRQYEHALALARFDQAARDQLVVRGLRRVLRESELFLERAHRRQPAAGGQCARGDLALHAGHDVGGGRPARTRRHV